MSVPSSSFTVDDPGNGVGTTDVPSNYEVDDHSGFRLRPHQGVEDGYGRLTHPDRADPKQPQDTLQSVGNNRQRGPQSPEFNNSFYGETDADTLAEISDLNTQHKISETVTMSGNVYGSIYIKYSTLQYAGITLTDDRGYFYSYVLDLSTGSFSQESNDGRLTTLTSGFSEALEDYYRIVIGADYTGATTITLSVNLLDSGHTAVGNKNNYAYIGSGQNAAIWGAQLSATDIGYTTSASNLISTDFNSWNKSSVIISPDTSLSPLLSSEVLQVSL